MLYALDLIGTFAFALSRAFKGPRHEPACLGISVLSELTGVGGRLILDMLLNSTREVQLFWLRPRIARYFCSCRPNRTEEVSVLKER